MVVAALVLLVTSCGIGGWAGHTPSGRATAGPTKAVLSHATKPTAAGSSSHVGGVPHPPPGPVRVSVPSGWESQLVAMKLGRFYLLVRPKAITGAVPLVVVLHGRNMTTTAAERLTQFPQVTGPAVIVYPAGVSESWNAGYCCGRAHALGVDDVTFLKSVIAQVLATQPGLSVKRVYLVGYSNGGRMAYRMACADPGAFAGVAAVEAVAVYSCDHVEPVPLLEVASSGDPLLTIPQGAPPKHIAGHTEITVESLLQQWRALEGCPAGGTESAYGHLTTTEWSGCRDGVRVEFAEYAGGSHSWPRGGSTTPSAQSVIWAFFHSSRPQVPPSGPADGSPGQAVVR